jgi:hypothetical protein
MTVEHAPITTGRTNYTGEKCALLPHGLMPPHLNTATVETSHPRALCGSVWLPHERGCVRVPISSKIAYTQFNELGR